MSEFVNTSETMGSEDAVLDALIAHNLAEFKDDTIVTLGQYAFYKNDGLASVELPSLTSVETNAFEGCAALASASFANSAITALPISMFVGCKKLQTVSIPAMTNIQQYAFQNCKSLNSLDLSGVTTIGKCAFDQSGVGQIVLPVCTSLGTYTGGGARMSVVDLTKTISIAANKFNGANALTHLILRSASLCSLGATSALTGTPIASGKGWVYVPTDLVDTYKAATNWSTYASQIVDIAEYPKTLPDETITDTWSEIFAAEDNGTYSTKYSVGDTKAVSVGGTSVIMQIVAMNEDPLASGNGNAKITWVATQILDLLSMNSTNTSTGGWASCELRSWLRDVIYPQIDSTVRAQIKEVTKTYRDYTNGVQTVTDTVWIPSVREIFGGTSYENDGPVYSSVFTDAASRVRLYGLVGAQYQWWLRSSGSESSFRDVNSTGGDSGYNASSTFGVVLGFCT